MLETVLALLFAHVLADFVFQSRAMIAAKRRGPVFALHIAIVAVTAGTCLGAASSAGWAALALVALSHAALDATKTFIVPAAWVERAPFRPLQVFALDQLGHLVFITLAGGLYTSAFSGGAWPQLLDETGLGWLLAGFCVVAGFWVAVRVGDFMLAMFMGGFRSLWGPPATDPDDDPDLPRAGAWIGWLERTLVFLFVLLGQFNAIGFVITAKSILRFQYARQPRNGEIVIIGTLASFGWAIVVALLTHFALDQLTTAAGGG